MSSNKLLQWHDPMLGVGMPGGIKAEMVLASSSLLMVKKIGIQLDQ